MRASGSEKGAFGLRYELSRELGNGSSFACSATHTHPDPTAANTLSSCTWGSLQIFLSTTGGREPWDLARFGRTVAFFNEDMSSPAKALTTVLTAPLKALVKMIAGSEAPVSEVSVGCACVWGCVGWGGREQGGSVHTRVVCLYVLEHRVGSKCVCRGGGGGSGSAEQAKLLASSSVQLDPA
jgi:hypothetical protein